MQEKLLDMLKDKKIEYELLTFKESVKDSKASASASKLDLNKIAKTVVFKNKKKEIYAAIIRSTNKVSKTKVKEAMNTGKIELIQFESVENYTGFPAGGVPPFGFDAKFIIDDELQDGEIVLVGGGTIYTLLKLKIKDIKMLSKAKVANIRQ